MKRGRNCKKNRGREALEKIVKRKCWRKMWEGTAGEIAGAWEALEKIARRKCWRKLRKGIAGG